MLAGLLLILIAGLFQGTYGLGMKKFQPLAWEAFWLLFIILSMIIIPLGVIRFLVPDLVAALKAVDQQDATIAIVMGALWGIGAIFWGKAIVYLGLSLTYGIGMSLTAISGSIGMLFSLENGWSNPAVPYIIGGVFVMVIGVGFITKAGLIRDKKSAEQETNEAGNKYFMIALVGIFLSGIFSGLLNIGFNRVSAAAEEAVNQGASAANASLVQWLFVFAGGFVIQLLYSLYLLFRNKTFNTFSGKGVGKALLITFGTALFWFAALAIYGQGATVMGELGPVVGWSMFLAVALIVSNIWGLVTGEWKGMPRALRMLNIGNVILIASWVLLGYANSF